MNNTLNNGLALLTTIADSTRDYGVTELARSMELPKSHVHRLLQSLLDSQLLDKTDEGRYALSLGVLKLSRELLLNLPIRRKAMPAMVALRSQTDLDLTLAVPHQGEAISVMHFLGSGQLIDSAESLGTVLTITRSASGKLFLAHESTETQQLVVAGLFPEEDQRFAFHQTLANIRQEGYSLREPFKPHNSNSFAVPVFDASGHAVAAVGAFGALTPELLADLLPVFQNTAQSIQNNLDQETA
ncbi:MAG: IclR family transcriptional regulator domain-containing protein [Puniceicoccales bacterium]